MHELVRARVCRCCSRARAGRARRRRRRRAIASGNDVIRPTIAAVSASSSRFGPSATCTRRRRRWFRIGPDEQRAARPRARRRCTHTWVDTGSTRDAGERRRARVVGGRTHGEAEAGALEQEARARATSTGTATSTTSWSPRRVMSSADDLPAGRHERRVLGDSVSIVGSWSWSSRITCATPSVAMNSSSRGWWNSRRTTSSSVSPPRAAPQTTASGNDSPNGMS